MWEGVLAPAGVELVYAMRTPSFIDVITTPPPHSIAGFDGKLLAIKTPKLCTSDYRVITAALDSMLFFQSNLPVLGANGALMVPEARALGCVLGQTATAHTYLLSQIGNPQDLVALVDMFPESGRQVA